MLGRAAIIGIVVSATVLVLFVVILPLATGWPFSFFSNSDDTPPVEDNPVAPEPTSTPVTLPQFFQPPPPIPESNITLPVSTLHASNSTDAPGTAALSTRVYNLGDSMIGAVKFTGVNGAALTFFSIDNETQTMTLSDTIVDNRGDFDLKGAAMSDKIILTCAYKDAGVVDTYVVLDNGEFSQIETATFENANDPVILGFMEYSAGTLVMYSGSDQPNHLRSKIFTSSQTYVEGPGLTLDNLDVLNGCVGSDAGIVHMWCKQSDASVYTMHTAQIVPGGGTFELKENPVTVGNPYRGPVCTRSGTRAAWWFGDNMYLGTYGGNFEWNVTSNSVHNVQYKIDLAEDNRSLTMGQVNVGLRLNRLNVSSETKLSIEGAAITVGDTLTSITDYAGTICMTAANKIWLVGVTGSSPTITLYELMQ